MTYRKDIQMLRGIAVLWVMLFHLTGTQYSSGFLGVDIFFVISGYLMARLYDPAAKAAFFIRRANRLLPAYFMVILATLLIALIRAPNDYTVVFHQSLWAMGFAANIGFWLQNSYFDAALFKPLLHLWSLGVEIQFYLLMPIVGWMARKMPWSLPITTLLSWGLCLSMVSLSPKTAFFWLPFRLWEFLAGFMVAYWSVQTSVSPYQTRLRALAWALLLILPLMPVQGQALDALHGHPGLMATLITLLTALILAMGCPPALEKHWSAGFLEKTGHYSYTLYLVHFPVIVWVAYQPFAGTRLTVTQPALLLWMLLLMAGLSALLFHQIERPCRGQPSLPRWLWGLPVLIGFCGWLGATLQNQWLPEKERLLYQALQDRSAYRCGKRHRLLHPRALSCESTVPLSNPVHRILLVGDSHADAIKSAFAAQAQTTHTTVYFMVENTPLLKHGIRPKPLIEEAQRRAVNTLVLHYSPDSVEIAVLKQVVSLAQAAAIQVAFILPVPVWERAVPELLLHSLQAQAPFPIQTGADYLHTHQAFIAGLNRLSAQQKLRLYPVVDIFCTPICQTLADSGRPLYFDRDHLTLTGSQRLVPLFIQLLADVH